MKKLWNKFKAWNSEADENSVLYNLLHLLFWAVIFGVAFGVIILFG